MITINSTQQSAITANVRHQRYAVQIELDSQTLRLASGGTYTVNGVNFVKSGVYVDQIKTGKGGVKTARVTIPNPSHTLTLLALTDTGFNYKRVTIWEWYGDSDPSIDDLNQIFQGEVYSVPSTSRALVLDCATEKMKTKMVPDLNVGPPDINHLPVAGEKFTVGNEIYTIEID